MGNKLKVVLVVAPDGNQRYTGYRTMEFLGRMPNLGPMYLAAVLEASGHEVVILDHQHDHMPALSLASEIYSHEPDVVGFTLYDVTMQNTHQTISFLRLQFDGPVVVGGYVATFHAEDILEHWPEVDYVVVREGEYALLSLLDFLMGNTPIERVPNLVHRENERIIVNQEQSLVDVTSLPWPQRKWDTDSDITPILSRRGCRSRCSFCSMVPFYKLSLGPIVRSRAPAAVADEMASCAAQGATDFMFYDDDFGLSTPNDREFARDFAAELGKRELRIHWGVELRVADVIRGEEEIRLLAEVGLTHISLGMESMLPRQLRLFNKGYKQADVFSAVELARVLPVDFQTNVIFWDPWTTLGEAVEHVHLLDQIRIQDQLSSANFPFFGGVLLARRGTKMHQVVSDAGIIGQRPGVFWEYEVELIDERVRAFRAGAHSDFLSLVQKIQRPPAMWLFAPRWEHAGLPQIAAAFRRYAKSLANTEFDYYRELLETCHRIEEPAEQREAVHKIHAAYAPRLDACQDLLPRIDGVPIDITCPTDSSVRAEQYQSA